MWELQLFTTNTNNYKLETVYKRYLKGNYSLKLIKSFRLWLSLAWIREKSLKYNKIVVKSK
jgi:hypothetical protein